MRLIVKILRISLHAITGFNVVFGLVMAAASLSSRRGEAGPIWIERWGIFVFFIVLISSLMLYQIIRWIETLIRPPVDTPPPASPPQLPPQEPSPAPVPVAPKRPKPLVARAVAKRA